MNHLIQTASNLLSFLDLVDESPSQCAGSILRNAIRIYEVSWLPLAAKQGRESKLLAAPPGHRLRLVCAHVNTAEI